MTFMNVDLDNKYDAWSPDNNEDLITYTDRQGFDNQKLSAISLESSYLFKNGHKILTIISKSNSNMEQVLTYLLILQLKRLINAS